MNVLLVIFLMFVNTLMTYLLLIVTVYVISKKIRKEVRINSLEIKKIFWSARSSVIMIKDLIKKRGAENE